MPLWWRWRVPFTASPCRVATRFVLQRALSWCGAVPRLKPVPCVSPHTAADVAWWSLFFLDTAVFVFVLLCGRTVPALARATGKAAAAVVPLLRCPRLSGRTRLENWGVL